MKTLSLVSKRMQQYTSNHVSTGTVSYPAHTFGASRRQRHLLLIAMTLFVSIGYAWGTDVTKSIKDYASANSWANGTQYLTVNVDANIIVTATNSSGSNTGKYYSTDDSWRMYANESATITVTAATGYTLSSITFTFTTKDYGTLLFNYSNVTSEAATSVSGSSATFSVSQSSGNKGKVFITAISVSYTSSGGGGTPTHTLSSSVTPASSGTVALSSSTVAEGSTSTATATPAEHYVFSSWSISGTGASLSSTTDNPTTVSIGTADATVTATFSAAPKASITLSEAGITTTDNTNYYVGDSYTLPTTTSQSCGSKVLVGWSTVAVAETNTKPTSNYYEKGASVTLAASQTFYAVYATASGGGGSNGSITIDTETTNFPTSYGTANTFTEYTLEGYNFKVQQVYINGTKLQWRADGNSNGTGTIYNTETFPGKITSIVVLFDQSDTNKNHTLQVGNSENPTSGTSISGTADGNTVTFDCSGGSYDYFVLTNGSGAGYVTSFTINYGSPTTYSAYSTSCAAPTQCATPTFSVEAGTYNAAQSVTISCATSGATIYYTTDGSTPTNSSNEYSSEISIDVTKTLKAIAIKSGLTNSEVASATYTLKCATPTFTPAAGSFTSAQSVSISCTSTGAAIHYTTNGDTPTSSSTTYSSAIAVSTTTTIKAIATKTDWSDSDVASGTFSIVDAETYELVTDASSLAAGDEIIFVSSDEEYAMGSQGTNLRNAVAASGNFTYDSGTNTISLYSASVKVITLGQSNNHWTLEDDEGFLYANSSSSNYIGTRAANSDANSQWDITIDASIAKIQATGDKTRNVIKYNYNTGNPRFTCYADNANSPALKIFRKEDADKCKTPTFTPAAGTYNVTQTVTISCATAGATIYYTTDGSTPTSSSTAYSSAISVSSTTTIKAIAIKAGMTNSNVATATYTISSGGSGGGSGDCGIFSETWSGTLGTGGNDGEWSGNIATKTIVSDNDEWDYSMTNGGGDQCIRTGKAGYMTTPSISVTNGTTYELTYNACDWGTDGCSVTISATGANITSGATSGTLSTGAWGQHSATLEATSTSMTITFTASSGDRFFLDEVCISEACSGSNDLAWASSVATNISTAETSTLATTGGNGEAVSYSIVSSNASTATITGSTFTASDAGTYTVKAQQPTTAGGDCGKSITINIVVTFAPVTVTLSRNGVTESIPNVAIGTALDDIDGSGDQGGCEEWTFVGWTKTERPEQDNTAAMTLVTTVDGAGPYYAVYKNSDAVGEGSTYTLQSGDESSSFTIATGVTGAFALGGGNNVPFWSAAVRAYPNNTLTITSTSANLTRIAFTFSSSYTNEITCSSGEMSNSNKLWTGDAVSSVTFTIGGTKNHRAFTTITIGGGGTTYYSTSSSCGPNIRIIGQKWVTSTAGQTIKAILTVRAGLFHGAATMSATSSNSSRFSITGTGNGLASNAISEAGTAETTLTVEYTPVTTADGTEQTTLTVSATDPTEGAKSCTFILNGRHMPDKFVMVAKSGDTWWALPANMSGADKYAGVAVTVDNDENPTTVTVAPYSTIYSIAAVNSANYAEYGDKVRFVGNLQKMLWGTDSNSAGTINNNAQYGIANENTTHNYEWTLSSTDGIEYTLQNVAYDIKDGNTAGYHSLKYFESSEKFGMYVNGQKNFRFLPATCSTKPIVTKTETTSSTATLTWSGDPSQTYNLFVKKDNAEVASLRQTNIESPVTIETLLSETTYTYIISPSNISDACALTGEFTTASAPISFTLSRRGVTETISNVQKPYELPISGDACDDWTFVGWSASTVADGSTSYSNVTHATTDGATYYAVYKKVSGGSAEYTLVTSASQLVANKTYIIAYYDDTEKEGSCAGAFSDKYFTQNTASTFSPDGQKITSVGEGTQEFILGGTSGNWTFTCAGGIVKATKVKNLVLGGDNGDATWNISISSSGDATIQNNNTTCGYLKYNPTSPRFLNYSETAQNMALPRLYVGGTGATYGTFASTCVSCSAAGAYFTLGNEVHRNTESANFTNTVEYEKNNTKTQQWSSSNNTVADVNATTGEVTINGEGTTTITMKQDIDDSNSSDIVCAVKISYDLIVSKPTVEVVEVTRNDEIIIEHDMDDTNSTLVLSQLVESTEGNIADDIFISKYFEAASNMKLFALYNGTTKYMDMTKLRIRSNDNNTTAWTSAKGQYGYLELKDVKKLGEDFKDFRLPPCTEIIFWSNNYGNNENTQKYNRWLRNCISMTIGDIQYDYDDMENGDVPNWYCVGDPISYYNADSDGNKHFIFNGDDCLILERTNDGGITWEAIDIFGAGSSAAAVLPESSSDSPTAADNGKILTDNTKYSINGSNVKLNDSPGGFWAISDDPLVTIPLSTNRYYLVRKNTVKSGYDAVANNTEVFTTLTSEWKGEPVGGETGYTSDSYCYSGQMFSEVGQYDFAHYYSDYEDLNTSEYDFIHNSDGTYSVSVNDLAQYSCKSLRVEVRDVSNPTDVKARVDYQVPIIVKEGTKTTIDEIFMNHDIDECASCNVVILDGGILQKSNEPGARRELNDLEIYPGGKLDMQTGKDLSINQLIMRSREDVVSRAATYGTLNRSVSDIYFDKRITGQRWYWFTLPFDCDIADICYRNPEAAAPIFGVDYNIKYYDGATRATGVQTGNWKQFEGTTLKAGVGYILCVNPQSGHVWREIRFPMKNANLEDDSRDVISVPVKAFGATTDVRPNHLGWNLVGNPYLNDYKKGNITTPLSVGTYEKEIKDGRWTGYWNLNAEGEKGLRYVVVPTEGGYGDYEQVAIGTKDLEPFMSYFVQIDGTTDGEELNVEFKETNLPASSIRRRIIAEDEDTPISWVGVKLTNSNQESDETVLLVHNSFTDGYDMMDDLVKWRGDRYSRYSKPVLASRNNEGEMAFNALSVASAEAGIPLNYFAAAKGEYTFSLSDGYDMANVEKVELLDSKLQTTTDLMWSDYTFESERTDDQSRFYLSVHLRKSPDITTSTETFQPLSNIMIVGNDGQLMIRPVPGNANVWVYTADGKLISHVVTGSEQTLIVSVPQNGVYNIRIESTEGSQSFKTIVK